jgi:hypothetical protein
LFCPTAGRLAIGPLKIGHEKLTAVKAEKPEIGGAVQRNPECRESERKDHQARQAASRPFVNEGLMARCPRMGAEMHAKASRLRKERR